MVMKSLLSTISLDRAVGTFGKAKDLIVISFEWFVFLLRIRLISLASQKFISDIANDALQYCKMKGTASGSSRSKTKVGVFVAGYVIERFLLRTIKSRICNYQQSFR